MKKLIGLLTLLTLGCSDQKNTSLTTAIPKNENGVPQYTEVQSGGVKMITVDGKYQVWTKKIGSGDIKVLLLHGGPGFTHDYFECFSVSAESRFGLCGIGDNSFTPNLPICT